MRVLLPCADGPTCCTHHPHCPHQALAVPVEKPCGSFRVLSGQHGAKGGTPLRGQQLHAAVMDRLWHVGDRCNAVDRRLQIHACAPNDDRQPALVARISHFISRHLQPSRHRGALGTIQHTIEPVWNARFISGVRTRGQNTQIAV